MIEKIKAEIERLKKANEVSDDKEYAQYELDVACGYDDALNDLLSFIESLEKEQLLLDNRVQYGSIEAGIKAYAGTYSFNIESRLFPQLTKEQQVLWREEIENAVISGGEAGLELSNDERYKNTPKIKGWVARDKDNAIILYSSRPKRERTGFWKGNKIKRLPDDFFSELTWENIPIEVELEIHRV